MKKNIFRLSLLAVICSGLSAGEHTVVSEDFEKTVVLEGMLLPEKGSVLRIEPQAWESYPVEMALSQGAAVDEGTVVVKCDSEDLDRKISDEEAAKKIRDLDLRAAQLELADLETNTPRQLAAAERAYQRAKEDLEYFKETGRSVKEQAAELSVDRAKRQLEYQTEELNQLLKMYAEDDLTEETEEIILKRQRSAVKDSKQFLERSIISKDKTLKTELPRQLVDLTEKFETAKLALATRKKSLPRALAKKRLEIKKMTVAHTLADKKLVELREDRSLMKITSPVKGHLYYGEISEGRWSVGQAAKYLKRGGKIPKHVNFATIVPEGAEFRAETAAEESQVAALRVGQEGYFSPQAAPRKRLKGKILSLASHPNLSGAYPLVFGLSGAADRYVTGMKGKITIVSERVQGAITVPVAALHEENDGGFSVKIKVGENSEPRRVTLGPETKNKAVVSEGLEVGEVVIVGKGEKKE